MDENRQINKKRFWTGFLIALFTGWIIGIIGTFFPPESGIYFFIISLCVGVLIAVLYPAWQVSQESNTALQEEDRENPENNQKP